MVIPGLLLFRLSSCVYILAYIGTTRSPYPRLYKLSCIHGQERYILEELSSRIEIGLIRARQQERVRGGEDPLPSPPRRLALGYVTSNSWRLNRRARMTYRFGSTQGLLQSILPHAVHTLADSPDACSLLAPATTSPAASCRVRRARASTLLSIYLWIYIFLSTKWFIMRLRKEICIFDFGGSNDLIPEMKFCWTTSILNVCVI